MPGQGHIRENRVNELDLLRFIAALSVVIFHYGFYDWVDKAQPLPAVAAVTKWGSTKVSTWGYFINMTMLGHFVGVGPLDGVYWTLFVELRFYAMVTVILMLGAIDRAELLVATWLAADAVLYVCPPSHTTRVLQVLLLDSYGAFFIVGAGLYLIWSSGPTVRRLLIVSGASTLGMVQMFNNLPALDAMYRTFLNPLVVLGIIAAFCAAMIVISLRVMGRLGKVRWLQLGALTYPLYLVHNRIGFIALHRIDFVAHPAAFFLLMIAGAVGCAYLVHVMIEKRFARILKRALNAIFPGDQGGAVVISQGTRGTADLRERA